MCLDERCFFIEIIEIHDDVKVVLHFARDNPSEPIFVQYWDNSTPLGATEPRNIKRNFELVKPKKTIKFKKFVSTRFTRKNRK